MNGTFWPTTISASWLSVVRMLGAERMLTSFELTSEGRQQRHLRWHDGPVRQANRSGYSRHAGEHQAGNVGPGVGNERRVQGRRRDWCGRCNTCRCRRPAAPCNSMPSCARCVSRRDFHDDRFDVDLPPADVELLDHAPQDLEILRRGRDHQRVGGGVGGDADVAGEVDRRLLARLPWCRGGVAARCCGSATSGGGCCPVGGDCVPGCRRPADSAGVAGARPTSRRRHR